MDTNPPSHLQVRTAVESHLRDGRIGREMLAAEEAIRQAKANEGHGTEHTARAAASMAPPAPRLPRQDQLEKVEEQRRDTRYYYANLFPYDAVHRWGSRAWVLNGPEPHNREWGWEGFDGSPFVRHLSCATASDLKKMVTGPTVGKINMGPMYHVDPTRKHREQGGLKVQRKEFIIDIDWTDYPGSSSNFSQFLEWWPGIAVGLEVCGRALREGFGFKHLLFVYSGRRGGHIWVCDERATQMDDATRSAVADFLSVRAKNADLNWRDLVEHGNFTSISKNLMIPFFKQIGIKPVADGGLGLFDIAFQRKQFLKKIHVSIEKDLDHCIGMYDTPIEAVNAIEKYCQSSHLTWIYSKYEQAIWDLLGPRIDAQVSKHGNHTLKIPFSVHPKTGRVSVPILGDYLHAFPITTRSPTVTELRTSESAREQLAQAVALFNKFIDGVASSPTEQWIKPDYAEATPPSKKQRVHDMTGALATPPDKTSGGVEVVVPYPRVCWIVHKFISVKMDADEPTKVYVYQRTRGYSPVARLIKSFAYPPFPHESAPPTPEGIVTAAIRTIKELAGRPTEELSVVTRPKVMLIRRDCSVSEAEVRFARLQSRLEEPDLVCTLDIKWGDVGMESMLRQRVLPLLEELDEI